MNDDEDKAVSTAIELEKVLCDALGKTWQPGGRQSVYDLVYEAAAALKSARSKPGVTEKTDD